MTIKVTYTCNACKKEFTQNELFIFQLENWTENMIFRCHMCTDCLIHENFGELDYKECL